MAPGRICRTPPSPTTSGSATPPGRSWQAYGPTASPSRSRPTAANRRSWRAPGRGTTSTSTCRRSSASPSGATLTKAVGFLIRPAELGPSAFPYPDLDVFDRSLALDKLHAAAAEAGDRQARAALALVPAPAVGDLWPVQPVCWLDDSGPQVQKP